jgi:hypothetical protein
MPPSVGVARPAPFGSDGIEPAVLGVANQRFRGHVSSSLAIAVAKERKQLNNDLIRGLTQNDTSSLFQGDDVSRAACQ